MEKHVSDILLALSNKLHGITNFIVSDRKVCDIFLAFVIQLKKANCTCSMEEVLFLLEMPQEDARKLNHALEKR